MTSYYGHYKDAETHPLAVRIWGHRLRSGQHWIEYMLEFLGVLSGFQYRLGQGLPGRDTHDGYLSRYQIPNRLGLRRFVFYDEREKTRDSRDTRATAELRRRLRLLMTDGVGQPDDEVIEQVRSLLRSFSAIEEERSWYAKTLFPVHEEFLLWEALRKGSTKQEYRGSVDHLEIGDLDQGVEFLSRNFFARGGELYYLIISAGTEGALDRRERIGQRLRRLLTEHNQGLGRIAHAIDETWGQLVTDSRRPITGELGWIPDPACPLYTAIAEDLDTFLDNDLDSLECLELLAHLIGFHIVSYIYHRAQPASHSEGHDSGSCQDACRPLLLVDLLGEKDRGVVREQSAAMLREQDDLQLRQVRDLIGEKFREWVAEEPSDTRLSEHLEYEANGFFSSGRTRTKEKFAAALAEIRSMCAVSVDRQRLVEVCTDAIYNALSAEFRRNFHGVHRKIGRAIGLVAPRKGAQIRFTLGDTLLKTLVMATLRRDEELPFGVFLDRLYMRYGIVVGPGEARTSGLMSRLRINEEYYARNRDALLGRMQRAGLLTQYSDATALVKRR